MKFSFFFSLTQAWANHWTNKTGGCNDVNGQYVDPFLHEIMLAGGRPFTMILPEGAKPGSEWPDCQLVYTGKLSEVELTGQPF